MTSEEENCVKHFEDSHSFAEDGKFLVRLPLKVDRSHIAPTRKRAENELARVQNKLHGELKKAYSNFMAEYLDLGHMSPVDTQNCGVYYIPHREVLREASSTTPLRVVFNASAKTAGKCSLNEALMIGPTIQRDLFDILISFRLHKFVFIGDIEKMYRMIWVHPSDRDLQHILWTNSAAEPMQEFQLNTLTYGTSPASFIAQKCLVTIADACQSKLPSVAKIIKENFYMDNLNVGHDDEIELMSLCEGIRSVLLQRGFNLRKFLSNSSALLNSLAPELQTMKNPSSQNETTILGLNWNPTLDNLGIKLCTAEEVLEIQVSKRIALSVIATTFDPLGLVAPVLITGKVLLQEFWKEGKEWDAFASDGLNKKFHDYVKSTRALSDLKIPRQIFEGELDSILAFCDASERAYCAVLYARYRNASDEYCCRFVCSKTRVAPLKELTIPKLELQAAKLLADLVKRVCHNIGVDLTKALAFSDSTTVLCWLSKPADNWKTFVRNRVEKIVGIIPFRNWRYVKTHDNPADKATRGLSAAEFRKDLDVWFDGPAFVREGDGNLFYPIPDLDTHECLEKRKLMNKVFVCASIDSSILDKLSSYQRLINTFARVLRFVNFCKFKIREKAISLSVSECEKARKILIRMYQGLSYGAEIESLKNNVPLKSKSSLIALDPFLDDELILRVGGRLKNSPLPLEKKHPIIISGQSSFIKLYCRYVHEKYYHAGKKFLLAFLVSEFWIHKGRMNLVKAVIRSCVVCRRMRGQAAAQIMGQLPLPRIQIARPFTYVGVDYAGYFDCKCTSHRTTRFYKVYAAVFVCLVTRAIHIEVVADLTADALMEAILCMVSRRGIPKIMFSDQGTNMTGAKNLLSLLESEKLISFATKERFDWKVIPPRLPNFGGIWEAGVKSAKWHLATAAKNQALTIIEYRNLFSRIEAILNSRPLCYKIEAEQGSEVITPAHFLVGGSLLTVPVLDFASEISLSRRLQLLQNQMRSFWNVWSRDYLNQMQQRVRWTKRRPNLKKGQIVLVKSDKLKPFQWPLGRIEKTYPDSEGGVCVVEVQLADGLKKRAISSVIPLLSEEEFSHSIEK